MTAMTEQWAILWYQCLSENYDYSLYADARLADDVKTCREYERQFDKIAEIYEDFGKLISLDDCNATPESYRWTEWFELRRHLFMPRVEVIGNGQAPNVDNSVVLMVPLGASLEETVAATRSQIAKAYALSDSAGTTPPKYRLHEINQNPAVKYDLVRHAVITSISKWSYQPSPGTGDLVNQVSIEFMQRHLDDMGWRLGAKEREDLMERDYIPVHMQDTYVFADFDDKQVHVYGRSLDVAYANHLAPTDFGGYVDSQGGFEGVRKAGVTGPVDGSENPSATALTYATAEATVGTIEVLDWKDDAEDFRVMIAVRNEDGITADLKDAKLSAERSTAAILMYLANRKELTKSPKRKVTAANKAAALQAELQVANAKVELENYVSQLNEALATRDQTACDDVRPKIVWAKAQVAAFTDAAKKLKASLKESATA